MPKITNYCYIPIPAGKPSQEGRVKQKGSTNNQCIRYAIHMITPRKGDPDYPKNVQLLETLKKTIRAINDPNPTKVCDFFYNALGMKDEQIFKPIVFKIFQLHPGLEVTLNNLISPNSEDRITRIAKLLKLNPLETKKQLYLATVIKKYREVFNLCISEFRINESDSESKIMDNLINALNKNGPIFTGGFFGSSYYSETPSLINDPIINPVFGWKKPRDSHDPNAPTHAIIICGAAKIEENGKTHNRIYFVDPNDSSDPAKETVRKTYVMPPKTLRTYIMPYETMEIEGDLTQLCYGVQKSSYRAQ